MIQSIDINNFGFLNCYRARYYDPALGRFLSEDPAGFNSGDVNSYRYVSNNPVNYRDPSGLKLVYGCDLARKEFQDDIERIRTTPDGRRLLELLENSDKVFTIHLNFMKQAFASGNNVHIDPSLQAMLSTNRGPKEASVTRILAHELGHLSGVPDRGTYRNMGNVILNENPIMAPLEGYSRNNYGGFWR